MFTNPPVKKIFFIISLIILVTPMLALAHGGVSQNIGNVIVYLNQSPISPLVGEKVDMNFVVRDISNQPLSKLDVKLTLIDTFYGDESKDKEILQQNFKTDNNGAFDFSYTFNKENYFDVDLDFVDPITHKSENTGFLVQPRAAKTESDKIQLLQLFIASIGGLVVGLLITKIFKK
ncbi:MAG TPA: hypothetical protein VE973_00660 [Candidatus Limnocylindria bacterium]|nr:hypothetical protein [Candidatus Limnocylindria bacterium]